MNQKFFTKTLLPTLLALAALLTFSMGVHAAPYASGITGTNGAGYVSFVMNEDGAKVVVTFSDATTLDMGVLPKGPTNFFLGAKPGFKITCSKEGAGNPFIISSDAVGVYTYSNSVWNAPSGVAVNKNPKNGAIFGRIYAANNFAGAQASGPKGVGIYAMNADQTLAAYIANPTVGTWVGINGGGANFKSPGRIRVAPDNSLLVADANAAGTQTKIYMFDPNLTGSTVLLGNTGDGTIADVFGTPMVTGSLAEGNLVLYTAQAGVAAPSDTNCILGPLTTPGSYNCIYKYNIGSGPLPWSKRPDYAYTVGLDGIAQLRPEVDVGADGKIYCGFGRANASNPNLQVLRPAWTTNGIYGDPANGQLLRAAASDQTNWLYTGGASYLGKPFNWPPTGGAAGDPWAGNRGSGANGGMYAGVRVSPDGKLVASVDLNNGVTLASLTNGIPDDGTIFGIDAGTFGYTIPAGITGVGAETANSRGMDWDAAGNIWIISSGQGLLRCFSLGQTTTCVSSNDWTGTNGTFAVVTPDSTASLTMSATASQNYTNNTVNPGAPIPGTCNIFFFNGSPIATPGPTLISFVRGGTAVYGVNYVMNTNETPATGYGNAIIGTNSVILPAGIPAGGFVSVGVKIIPTATPLSGPTFTFTMRLVSGTNYNTVAPFSGTMDILNTGPQLIFLTAPAPSTLAGMNRGIPGDQARFVLTRYGDLNGPGNDATSIVPKSFTITNFLSLPPAAGASFMANLGVDYMAGVQRFTGVLPVNGSPGVVFNPGLVTVDAMIGNPVKHVNTSQQRTNLSVVLSLTNTVPAGSPLSTTNAYSSEGHLYQVRTTTQTLTEFDNAFGGEVVLWSNPLTNSYDSTNWTLVYASINQDASPTLPTVISNYDNSASFDQGNYYAVFGKSVNDAGNDGGVTVPQSDTMAANGWNTALKLSVNKNTGELGESGINLYPQIPGMPGKNYMIYRGNYALRFDMFLSLYGFAIGNPTQIAGREFAAFGINHFGTNANWRLDINPRADGTGAKPINADGLWCAVNAASGSITPADYDMFISPPWINPIFDQNGVNTNLQVIPFTTNYFVGTNSTVVSSGYLIQVAYTNAYATSAGNYSPTGPTNIFNNAGVPNDQVSGNNNGFGGTPQNGICKNPPFTGMNTAGGAPVNAWVEVSLELSRQTNLTLYVAQQQIFKSSILTPTLGAQNPIAPFTGTPMLGYLDPNLNASFSDAFVYFSNLRVVELSPFIPWTNQPVAGLIVTQGASFTLESGATFASNPLTNTWYRGTTNGPLASTAYGNRENGTPTVALVTNTFASTNGIGTLTINNIQSGTNFISTWSDQAGWITNYNTVVEVIAGPGNKTALLGATTNFTVVPSGNRPPTSYQWRSNGVNLANSAHYAGVTTATLWITNVSAADATVFSCLVANADASVVAAGTLTVDYGFEPYGFTGGGVDLSGNVGLAFSTLDPADTASSFILQAAGLVTGPYTNYPFGVFSGANPNFLVTVPKTNATMFFRLKHN